MDKLDELFEVVFGYQGHDLSCDEKFNMLQKKAYEIGDRATLTELERIKDSEEIQFSSETLLSFEDSLHFLAPHPMF